MSIVDYNTSNTKHLKVIKKLSKAKFSVYLIHSQISKVYYAMKVFPYKYGKPHPYFNNEMRFANIKHPNIINIYCGVPEREVLCQGVKSTVSYILMEYAPYGDFFNLMTNKNEILNDKFVRTYFRQFIEGLEHLHSKKMAHLDLKPENLLLGADLNLKIADFDLSYIVNDPHVVSKGTKYYRGPEFFRPTLIKNQNGNSVDILKTCKENVTFKKAEIKSEPQMTKKVNTEKIISDPFACDIYAAGVVLFTFKSSGTYPHSENLLFDGVDLVNLMYYDNDKFWTKHCEIQKRPEWFYDEDFKKLFNLMVKKNPKERITIENIKKTKWYNGPIYTLKELQEYVFKIIKFKKNTT